MKTRSWRCAAALGVALSCVAGTSGASAQAGRTPDQLGLAMDTSKLELRVIGTTLNSRRQVADGVPFESTNGTLRGVEGWVMGAGAGLYGRYIGGAFGDESHSLIDARVMFGDGRTMVEGGWIQRSRPGEPDSTEGVARAGVRLQLPIGGSGATVYLGGGGYIPVRAAADTAFKRNSGWDGESGIRYRMSRWRLPFEIMLGYRLEYFVSRGRQEEVSSVVLGAGINVTGR